LLQFGGHPLGRDAKRNGRPLRRVRLEIHDQVRE
jgi:hypothetical protein